MSYLIARETASQMNSFRYQWRLLYPTRDSWVLSGQGSCPATLVGALPRSTGEQLQEEGTELDAHVRNPMELADICT
jgi:phage protein U